MKSSIFPKYHQKNLIEFCPGRFYRLGTCDLFWLFSRRLYWGEWITYLVWINFQGRNLSNFLGGFWKIDDFISTFWLHLTFTYYKTNKTKKPFGFEDCTNFIFKNKTKKCFAALKCIRLWNWNKDSSTYKSCSTWLSNDPS